jgi:hypothetical protein
MGRRGCNMIFQTLTCKALISFSTPLHALAAQEEVMLQPRDGQRVPDVLSRSRLRNDGEIRIKE